MEQDYTQSMSASVDVTTTGDKTTFQWAHPVDILRVGLLAASVITVGAGMVIKFDKRPTMGSDTNRGDGDVGALTRTSGQDVPAGKGLLRTLAQIVQVDPGQQVVGEVTDAADTAGASVFLFVLYKRRPIQTGRIANFTIVTA